MKDEFKQAGWSRAINRTLQIIFAITFILVINIIAARQFTRHDLTQNHRYSLSAESLAYLKALKGPIDVYVTIPRQSDQKEVVTLYNDVSNILREYEFAVKSIHPDFFKVHYIDIYQQRKVAEELNQRFGLQKDNVVYVASGKQFQVILPSDLYGGESGKITGFKGEQAITSAILEVTSGSKDKIYFLTGHGEMRIDDTSPLRGLSELYHSLQERNLDVAAIDLSTRSDVPEDASCLIIPSPQSPLLASEAQKVRHYLEEDNGRAIFLLDPAQNHGLDELLYEWGILSDDMLVIDTGKDFQSAEGDLIIRRYAEHSITKPLIDFQLPILVGLSRPARPHPGAPLDERQSTITLIASSDESWGERAYFDSDTIKFDSSTDQIGPVSIAALTERRVNSELGINIPGGRVVAFGNADFISNNRFNTLGNKLLFTNTVLWTLDRESLLSIPPKSIEDIQFTLSRQDLLRTGMGLSILPAVVLILGISISWMRRR